MSSVLPSAEEKPRFVAAMFGRIAARYDLMNTLMTFGQDARWRRAVADALPVVPRDFRVLDVGTGTGALAAAIVLAHPTWHVVGADFTLEMLRQAPTHLATAGADALQLPFADGQFDAVVSGFVIRNVADVERGLAEQIRVLRPGGTLVILETTPGPSGALGVIRPLYRAYFRHVVPLLGGLIAGDATAYTYLPESTLAFLEPARLVKLLQANGMEHASTRRLMLGSVALTLARKPVIFPAAGG